MVFNVLFFVNEDMEACYSYHNRIRSVHLREKSLFHLMNWSGLWELKGFRRNDNREVTIIGSKIQWTPRGRDEKTLEHRYWQWKLPNTLLISEVFTFTVINRFRNESRQAQRVYTPCTSPQVVTSRTASTNHLQPSTHSKILGTLVWKWNISFLVPKTP